MHDLFLILFQKQLRVLCLGCILCLRHFRYVTLILCIEQVYQLIFLLIWEENGVTARGLKIDD